MTLVYGRQPVESASTRAGFSISKRVGNAVLRNRVKRRMRDIFRRQRTELALGWDLVFSAKPAAGQASYSALADEIGLLITRAGLHGDQGNRGQL